MDRPEIERRTLAYLDEHDGEAVELLRGLVRVRSLARQEGTARLPGTIVARLRPELGRRSRLHRRTVPVPSALRRAMYHVASGGIVAHCHACVR